MSTASRKLLRAYKNQSPVIAAPNGFPSLVLDEQFLALDPTRWHIYDNSTFGAPTRIQRYMAYNAVTGTAAGAMGGTSLRLKSVH